MARLSHELEVDQFDPAFEEVASQAWTETVAPALEELEDLVEQRRFRSQFGAQLPTSGVAGTATGLVAALLTHAPVTASAVAAGATAAVGGAVKDRRELRSEIQSRPYYLLHRSETVLAKRVRA